jgi:hypothetical protein
MYYDFTLLHCFCGWTSDELTRAQMSEKGIPWYCDECGKPGLQFIHFHPGERYAAYCAFNVQDRLHPPPMPWTDSYSDEEADNRIG